MTGDAEEDGAEEPDRAETREQAEAEAARMLGQGYGGGEVRIVEVRKTWKAMNAPLLDAPAAARGI